MLFTISESPYQTSDLDNCSVIVQSDDAVLFYQDAVIAVQQGSELEGVINALVEKGVNVYALIEDCELRGIDNIYEKVSKIDYSGFVSLVEKQQTMFAW